MTNGLPEGYTTRAPRPGESETVFEFVRECEIAETGVVGSSLTELQEKWSAPKFDLTNDALLVVDPAGKIAGYAYALELHQPVMVGNAYTAPAFTGLGIGSFLVDWLERHMTEQIPKFDPQMQVVFTNWIASNNEAARRLLERKGYSQAREFWQMQIVMTEAPENPVWPGGISVRPMVRGQDDRKIYDVYEETFSDHWGHIQHPYEEYARWHYEREKFDPSLWFLAIDDTTGEIAGYALNFAEDGFGWVNTLGVRRRYRRLGLGLALLRHSFAEFYKRGLPEVRLAVDGESLTGATRLYTGAGMKPIMRFARFEKVVRPGVSLGVKELAE